MQFKDDVQKRTLTAGQNSEALTQSVFAKEDFSKLPPLLQKYLESCGYIGTPRKSVLIMEYKQMV